MERPTGTVTFLFSDIEGSTTRWDTDPAGMLADLKKHNKILTGAFEKTAGFVFKGTGDGFCVAFQVPDNAVKAAVEAQKRLAEATWTVEGGIRVRMGIHTGSAESLDNDYFGPTLNRVARVMDAAHGGQILVSSTYRLLIADAKLGSIALKPLGSIPLKGLARPEEVYQVVDPDLQPDFPPLRAPKSGEEPPQHNIASDERAFLGRAREIKELTERLRARKHRLVTVTGIGGMGKTRLAKEVAKGLAESYKDGVCLIECESLALREEFVGASLTALGAPGDSASPERSLIDSLKKKETLLVVDCFENLAAHTELLDAILKSAPKVSVLVTSRMVLNSPWEFEYPLGPMSLQSRPHSLSDSAALFVEAATHALPSFEVSAQSRGWVDKLVRALEGVPLAIILAAAKVRHLSLEELHEQVTERRLDMLRNPNRPKDKHSDLAKVIESSFALVAETERELAARLAVFENGFFLDDAAYVLDGEHDLIERIATLRDHSLLVCSVVQGRMRYRSLDTVREYLRKGASKLDLRAVRRRHAERYAGKAADIQVLYKSGDWQKASAYLWREAANFRAAVRFAIETEDLALIRSFAHSLARVYLEAGASGEFTELMGAASLLARTPGNERFLAELEGLQGAFRRRDNDLAGAERHWRNRLELLDPFEEPFDVAECLLDLANLAGGQGRLPDAQSYLDQFAAIQHRLPNGPMKASGILLQAYVHMEHGELAKAEPLAETARSMVSDIRADEDAFFVWGRLAEYYKGTGRPEQAIECLKRLIEDASEGGYTHYVGRALLEMADCYEQMGELNQAAFSLVAAASIPRNASPALKSTAKTKRLELERRHGSALLSACEKEVHTLSWPNILAKVLGPSPSFSAGGRRPTDRP